MKLYQLIMLVPDDFVPEKMQLNAICDTPVEICSEGFIGPGKIDVTSVSEPEASDEVVDVLTEGVDVVEDGE